MKIRPILAFLSLSLCLACGNNEPQQALSASKPSGNEPAKTSIQGTKATAEPSRNEPAKAPTQDTKPTTTTSLDYRDLTYRKKPVVLTKHAKCRMECRHIDASEIQDMLNNGKINPRKSGQSKDESTCPTVALEGKTHDNQTVRIIVAECSDKAKIVTVIDLKNDFKCDCK